MDFVHIRSIVPCPVKKYILCDQKCDDAYESQKTSKFQFIIPEIMTTVILAGWLVAALQPPKLLPRMV